MAWYELRIDEEKLEWLNERIALAWSHFEQGPDFDEVRRPVGVFRLVIQGEPMRYYFTPGADRVLGDILRDYGAVRSAPPAQPAFGSVVDFLQFLVGDEAESWSLLQRGT